MRGGMGICIVRGNIEERRRVCKVLVNWFFVEVKWLFSWIASSSIGIDRMSWHMPSKPFVIHRKVELARSRLRNECFA